VWVGLQLVLEEETVGRSHLDANLICQKIAEEMLELAVYVPMPGPGYYLEYKIQRYDAKV